MFQALKRIKLFIIHPGVQHSYRLANAAVATHRFRQVYLFTSILLKSPSIRKIPNPLKKRIKPISSEVRLVNFPIYTLIFTLARSVYNKIIKNPNKQVHNNPIYFFQKIFNWLCLPYIFYHRNAVVLVLYETAGWPLAKFAKYLNIPVIMDFPSISHEVAKTLGINETGLGIKLKAQERMSIDYAFFCSRFCKDSFKGLTSSKQDFTLYLGAETSILAREVTFVSGPVVKLSFIANLEYRKGLDLLLDALYSFSYEKPIEILLIGKIRPQWVTQHTPKVVKNNTITINFIPAMPQTELFQFLKQNQIDLNLQPSRFDSFAMVVPETMMQGIPNVVSPYVGAGELLDDGKDGFIMEDMTPLSIKKIIDNYILLTPDEIKALRTDVLQKAKTISWEQYGQQVSDAFDQILL